MINKKRLGKSFPHVSLQLLSIRHRSFLENTGPRVKSAKQRVFGEATIPRKNFIRERKIYKSSKTSTVNDYIQV